MKIPGISDLVEPLTKATEAGRLNWRTTGERIYSTKIGENSIFVQRAGDGVAVLVKDSAGIAVESRLFFKVEEEFRAAWELFTLVDRTVRKVDVIMTDILHHLEATSSSH